MTMAWCVAVAFRYGEAYADGLVFDPLNRDTAWIRTAIEGDALHPTEC